MTSSDASGAPLARCRVAITLEDRNGRGACLERNVWLPFVPIRGVELGWADPDKEPWSSDIVVSIYEIGAALWHVELEDWYSNELDLPTMVAMLGPLWRVLGSPQTPAA